jgi:hypothetical protein
VFPSAFFPPRYFAPRYWPRPPAVFDPLAPAWKSAAAGHSWTAEPLVAWSAPEAGRIWEADAAPRSWDTPDHGRSWEAPPGS